MNKYLPVDTLRNELLHKGDPQRARALSRFFKSGKGEYGEGDVFLGIPVPQLRRIARKFRHLQRRDLSLFVKDPIHEFRLAALCILTEQYKYADDKAKGEIVDFYLKNRRYINNWDLVDLSAYTILGDYVYAIGDYRILNALSRSSVLWDRRIAMIATFAGIRKNKFSEAIKVAEALISDDQDLIHKAVGWMLREIGKRDENVLLTFLDKHATHMPRTMLRYAIERFDENRRQYYRTHK